MERTLLVCKPDAVQRGMVGEILKRFEQRGLKIVGLKMIALDDDRARRLYSVHVGKEFFEALIRFVTSSPIVAIVMEGRGAISAARSMLGETDAPKAAAGTIRGDLALSHRFNLVHASDSLKSAEHEIAVLFSRDEILDYTLDADGWTYES
jgi:nucleoside-diphosphate kinase